MCPALTSLLLPDNGSESLTVHVLYPAAAATRVVPFGRFSIAAALEAPPSVAGSPCVILSAGAGGTGTLYRDLALGLVQRGFVVALPEHGRDPDPVHPSTAMLLRRPRHVRSAIDGVLAHAQLGPAVDPKRIAVVGHSLGGYTALAAAGGVPWTRDGTPLDIEHDARIGALVLLAPAIGWFLAPRAVDAIRQPLLILSGERDTLTPPSAAQRLIDSLPDRSRVTARTVGGAGHYSFLSPFAPEMRTSAFPPANDPPGFDRAAFQPQLATEVANFLQDAFAPPPPSSA